MTKKILLKCLFIPLLILLLFFNVIFVNAIIDNYSESINKFSLDKQAASIFSIENLNFEKMSSEDKAIFLNEKIKANGKNWVAKETPLARLNASERQKRLGLYKDYASFLENNPLSYSESPVSSQVSYGIPTFFDWRNKDGHNWISPIRSQAGCGSCWAFASAAVVESKAKINLNNADYSIDLAEQDIISCNINGDDCEGGSLTSAFDTMKSTGIVSEGCFPYIAADGSCGNKCQTWNSEKLKITSYSKVSATASAVKNALVTYGPLEIGMAVYEDFYYYSGGVYGWQDGSFQGYHAVAIVGYNDAGQYFIAKNSWDEDWGEFGFFNIAYDEIVLNSGSWDYLDWGSFFLDQCYYVSNTDIVAIPTIGNLTINKRYVTSEEPLEIFLSADSSSIKGIIDVNINGLSASGAYPYGGTYSLSATANQLGCAGEESSCIVVAEVTDDAEYTKTTSMTIKIDDLAPRVTNYTLKYKGAYVKSSDKINISATVVDANLSSVKVNDKSLTLSSGKYLYSGNFSGLNCDSNNISSYFNIKTSGSSGGGSGHSFGNCDLILVAEDGLHNVYDDLLTSVFVDDTFPEVISFTSDAAEFIPATNQITFTSEVSDNTEISLVSIKSNFTKLLNFTLVEGDNSSGLYQISVSPIQLGITKTISNTPITLIATDVAGNIVQNNVIYLNVDASIPQIKNFSSNMSYVKSSTLINLSAIINDSSVENVSINGLYLDGPYPNAGKYYLLTSLSELGCGGDEGNCSLNLTVFDAVGNSNSSILRVKYDDLAPRINKITFSSSSSYFKSSAKVNISINVTDANISSVKAGNISLIKSRSIYSILTNMSNLGCKKNEECIIYYNVTDAAGNYVDTNLTTITVDDSAPIISNIRISDTYVKPNQKVNISIDVFDNYEIKNVTAEGFALINLNNGTWAGEINLSSAPLNIFVVDYAGNNVTNSSVKYVIDSTLPTLSNLKINKKYARNGDSLLISFGYVEVNISSVSVKIGANFASFVAKSSTNYTYNYVVDDSDGYKVVNVTMIDEAGNIKSIYGNITIDSLVPELIGLINSSLIVKTNSTSNITINITELNLNYSKINGVLLTCKGNISRICSGKIKMNISALNIEIKDLAGNTYNESPYEITLDDQKPVIVTASSNVSGFIIGQNEPIFISAEVTDDNNLDTTNLIRNVQVSYAKNSPLQLTQQGETTWAKNITPFALGIKLSGNFSLVIAAFDNATNPANKSINISVDASNPYLKITSPLASKFYNYSNILINYTVNDSSFDHTDIIINDSEGIQFSDIFNEVGNKNFRVDLADSKYTFNITAYDSHLNKNSSIMQNIVIDTIAPEIILNNLVDNQVVSARNFSMNFSLIESNVKSTVVYVYDLNGLNKVSPKIINKTGYSLVNFSAITKKAHNINITCIDQVNHKTIYSLYNITVT